MLLAANTCFYAHLPAPRAAPAEFRMLGPSDSRALCAVESRVTEAALITQNPDPWTTLSGRCVPRTVRHGP